MWAYIPHTKQYLLSKQIFAIAKQSDVGLITPDVGLITANVGLITADFGLITPDVGASLPIVIKKDHLYNFFEHYTLNINMKPCKTKISNWFRM